MHKRTDSYQLYFGLIFFLLVSVVMIDFIEIHDSELNRWAIDTFQKASSLSSRTVLISTLQGVMKFPVKNKSTIRSFHPRFMDLSPVPRWTQRSVPSFFDGAQRTTSDQGIIQEVSKTVILLRNQATDRDFLRSSSGHDIFLLPSQPEEGKADHLDSAANETSISGNENQL
jgi:hypothetical protein